jgi:hypothetical protein
MVRRGLIVLTTTLLVFLASLAPAYAFNPFGGGACSTSKAGQSVACSTNGAQDPIAGSNGLFVKVTNIIAYAAGAIAIIIIIVGAIRFITAGSDLSTGSRTDTDVEDARRSIAGALIGLAIIILAKVFITYFVSKL